MIKTKSIYARKDEFDGKRILITRYYPRGVNRTHFDIWVKQLAPSKELLADWKAGTLTEDDYTKRYNDEMKCEESEKVIGHIAALSVNDTVTLLCIEREDGSFCHRHLLKKLIAGKTEGG